jgi:hypothetical protein
MKITRLIVKNYGVFEHFELEPGGKSTLITGGNGVGKTTLERAIADALGCGGTVELLRRDPVTGKLAQEGEIVLLLDDETRIRRRFTADGKDETTVHAPNIGKISKPATYLKKITSSLSVNPLSLLVAEKKKRVSSLLEAMPIEMTADEKNQLSSLGIKTHTISFAKDELSWLKGTRDEIFSRRQDVNRNLKEKRNTISQLSESLPSGPADSVRDELDAAERELEAHNAASYSALEAVNTERDAAIRRIEQKAVKDKDAVKTEYQNRLKELDDWKASELAKIEEASRKESLDAVKNFDIEKEEVANNFIPTGNQLSAKVATLRSQLEQSAKTEQLRSTINTLTKEADALSETSEIATSQLEMIDSVKESILSRLPVKGIEVVDGDIYIDGHPWDDVNTARRVEICIQIGMLRMGELRAMLVDDAEHFDEETFREVERQLAENDIQAFFSSVGAGELKVEQLEYAEVQDELA